MKTWRKMKTAPKNGKPVLLAERGYLTGNKGIRRVVSFWAKDKAGWGYWADPICGEGVPVIAIGWMPFTIRSLGRKS